MIKAHLLLIVLIAVLFGACNYSAKQQKKGYVLSIDQDDIGQPRDTVIHNKTYEFVLVPVKLSNFTKDTLKYMSMSCSWDVIFTINKNIASIKGWDCDNNFPTFSAIAPQKSFTYKIPVSLKKNTNTNNYTFKIGMFI